MNTKILAGIMAIVVLLTFMPVGGYGMGHSEDNLNNTTNQLNFSIAEDISKLDFVEVQKFAPPIAKTKSLRFSVDTSKCSLHSVDEYVYLKVVDLKPYTKPGEPQLPMKTFKVTLPKDAEIIGVSVVEGQYREIKNELNIIPAPAPQPFIWSDDERENRGEIGIEMIPDEKVYSIRGYFPGKALSYDIGSDGKYKYVFARIYPVQYIPKERKAILITDATINVYYKEGNESFFRGYSQEAFGNYSTDAENIIIAPPEFYEQAKELGNFHDSEGTSTEVINTTWIYQNYPEAEDPPYAGYNDSSIIGWENIQGYNYSLAKRTIAFFNDSSAHPNLGYITILGNARLVPPGYYIYISHYDTYNNWIPTDAFYASPDYDYVPNYMLGRLPVNSSAEAEHVVNKIKNWDNSGDWFKEVTMVGGKPFSTDYYVGELNIVDIINKDFLNGMNITELFRTNGNFDKSHVMDALSGNTGMMYVVTHGNGYGWKMEQGGSNIYVSDLLELTTSSKTPIVVSVACIDGAWDTNIYDGGFPTSFGEGVLLSNASGIAYIGGARVNWGGSSITIDKGYLKIVKMPYMEEMLTNVFEAYHNGANTSGDIFKIARQKYFEENGISYKIDKVTFFEFVLLGDPALKLPAQQLRAPYQKPNLTGVNPEGYSEEDIPIFNTDADIIIHPETNSPKVFTKRIDVLGDGTVETMENATINNTFSYVFATTKQAKYLVRMATEDKKEGWFYLYAFKPITGAPLLLVDDDHKWNEGAYIIHYENALDVTGYAFDSWSIPIRGTPDSTFLQEYDVIIWFTGDDWTRTIKWHPELLQDYLDSGGKLFVTGQDVGYGLTENGNMNNSFFKNYLHANYIGDDAGIYTLEGISTDSIGDGLTIGTNGGDGADNQNYEDEIEPADEYASIVFKYKDDGVAAIKADTGTYKVVYFAFGFEGINNATHRNIVMDRVLRWLIGNESLITSNVMAAATANSATITWNTNKPSDSLVKYGIEPNNYAWEVYDPANVTFHNITLSELNPNTTYFFVVNSTDLTGSSVQSMEYNFSTVQTSEDTTTISLANFEVNSGSTIKAPIRIHNVTAVVGGECNISFDPSVIHVTDVSEAELGAITSNINNEAGYAYTNVLGDEGKSGDVVFAYLNLTAVGNERDNSPLNISVISLFDINYTDISYNTDNGTFAIIDSAPPASISNLTNASGNFWIKWIWDNPSDADFNHTMVYIDGMFETNAFENYYTATYAPHATKTISTHSVDSFGNINLSWVNLTTTIPNNSPVLETIGDKTINETETLVLDANATDLDEDTVTYSCNRTDLFTAFNATTGIGSWTPSVGQAGTYYIDFAVADGFWGVDTETLKITVEKHDTTPPVITDPSANSTIILNDIERPRPPSTNVAELKATVTDDTGVQSVTINLSSVGGSADQQLNPLSGNEYSVTTKAIAGINHTHNLVITATDTSGNINTTIIQLTVLRRGDIFRDNSTDLKDAMYIARYLAGLEPEHSNPPSVLVGDVVGSGRDSAGDGIVDLKDAVYIGRYKAGLENEP